MYVIKSVEWSEEHDWFNLKYALIVMTVDFFNLLHSIQTLYWAYC
jgi:hypothetical protein